MLERSRALLEAKKCTSNTHPHTLRTYLAHACTTTGVLLRIRIIINFIKRHKQTIKCRPQVLVNCKHTHKKQYNWLDWQAYLSWVFNCSKHWIAEIPKAGISAHYSTCIITQLTKKKYDIKLTKLPTGTTSFKQVKSPDCCVCTRRVKNRIVDVSGEFEVGLVGDRKEDVSQHLWRWLVLQQQI